MVVVEFDLVVFVVVEVYLVLCIEIVEVVVVVGMFVVVFE